MRKLVFMLKVNPNLSSVTPKNLEISTHRGARLKIVGNQATVLDVTNDEMTDSELQLWYRSRYSGLGMGISIMHDPVEKAVSTEPVQIQENSEIKLPEKTEDKKPRAKKQSKKEQPVEVTETTDVVVPEEKVSVEVSESKVQEKESVVMPLPETTENSEEVVADLQSFLWS